MSSPYGHKEQIQCDACGEQVDIFRGEVIPCPMCGEEIDGREAFDRPPPPPKRPFYPPYSTREKVAFLLIVGLIYVGMFAFSACAGAM